VGKKIKIMFCIPSLGSGGAERVVSVLSNQFSECGFDVCVLLLSRPTCVYPLDEKVEVKCINCDDDMCLSPGKRFIRRLKKIRSTIKKASPDLVISFMSETNIDVCLALLDKKTPIIVSERNDPAVDPASRVKKIIRRFAYLKPKGFVFQTPDAKAYFSRRIQNRARIILNPVSPQLPAPCAECGRDKRIVAVGRLNRQKNFPLLMDAFSAFSTLHDEYILEIYGEGSLRQELTEYISSKGLEGRVILKGFCKDVHERIRSASMFVMSSDFEGMPNALLEAMTMGLTCISTDCPCGGPRMLIEHQKNGLLVPVGDRDALSGAMSYVAGHPEQSKKMASNAVKIREAADIERIKDCWIELISTCLGGKQ